MNIVDIADVLTLDNENYSSYTYNEIFDNIADTLLNKSILCINRTNYRICEIEFYLLCDDHNDVYVHGDEHQTSICKWYFHRHNSGTYKNGTFKGLDLTFGFSKRNNYYGGILIRSIQNLKSKKITEGPCNVVTHVLKLCNVKNILEFINKEHKLQENTEIPLSANKDNSLLKIIPSNKRMTNNNIFTAPRVGLGFDNSDDNKLIYIMKNYRYIIHPNKIMKNIFGLIVKLYADGKDTSEISKQTLIKKKKIDKYAEHYDNSPETDIKKITKITKNRNMPIAKQINIQKLCYQLYR